MKIIMGSDHAGFPLKDAVKTALAAAGHDVADVGTSGADSVDYPDFGIAAVTRLSGGEFERAILVCGSGVGMAIVANKFPGVRAAVCLDEETARLCRQHNDVNCLVLAGRKTDPSTAEGIVRTWLTTPFEGGRHQKRLEKIRDLERKLCT